METPFPLCSTREILDLLHGRVNPAIEHVHDYNVGEHGVGRHVANCDHVPLGQLTGEEGVLRVRAVRLFSYDLCRSCMSQLTGIVWKYSKRTSPKKRLR